MTYPTYHNLIGGQWIPAVSGKTILNLNPADHSDVIGAFPSSHAEDVAMAVAAAKKAFATWRLVPAPRRAEILLRAGNNLVQNKEKYARDMTREMGKVLAETRGDVQEAIDEAFYVAGEGRRLFGVTTPSELQNKFAMSVRMPVGVVGLITPWNFPMAIPSWKLFPALVAGNACIIKPATDTPLSTYNLVQALVDAETEAPASAGTVAKAIAFQFAVSVYGGYFGAGIGILMLSALALMGLSNIHHMNALKSLLGTLINIVSAIVFICQRQVNWPFAIAMALSAIVGGYAAARAARRFDSRAVRALVVVIGFTLAAYYFYQQFFGATSTS